MTTQITNDLIIRAYDKLGYFPRNNQVEVITEVLEQFITQKKKNVVLCLDTGSGKSIIAAVVAECIEMLTKPELTSFILMHQNTLTDQYYNSFKELPKDKFSIVKGAGQYPCKNLQNRLRSNVITAEECIKEHLTPEQIQRECRGCEFAESRRYLNKAHQLITNYSYFFISKLWSSHLEPRDVHIFDEAHMLNEVFSEHCSIYVSEKRLAEFIQEIEGENREVFIPEISILEDLRKQIILKEVTSSNYKAFLSILNESYKRIADEYSYIVDETEDLNKKVAFSKKYKKYFNLKCKIGDYFFYGYECVIDNVIGIEFTVKPIFIKDMISAFLSKYNLFMSATITEDYATTTFGLNPEETSFITADPVFDSQNRPLFFMGDKALNYTNMNEKDTMKFLIKSARKIVEIHKQDKGLILTPSFKLNEIMAQAVSGVKIFEHTRGINTAKLIEEFKECTEPAVLISPSLYEGLDLSGDSSRYQIIVKTPYASLGDKRTEYIVNHYPEIYKMNTLYKILQGIGRSVRSEEDYAYSYFLDKASQYLYTSKFNIWKNRYVTNLN